jgi:hypothetical protein
LLLLLLLLSFSFLSIIEFQLVVYTALLVPFLLLCTVAFSCQFSLFWGCWVDVQPRFSVSPAVEPFAKIRVVFHDFVPSRDLWLWVVFTEWVVFK